MFSFCGLLKNEALLVLSFSICSLDNEFAHPVLTVVHLASVALSALGLDASVLHDELYLVIRPALVRSGLVDGDVEVQLFEISLSLGLLSVLARSGLATRVVRLTLRVGNVQVLNKRLLALVLGSVVTAAQVSLLNIVALKDSSHFCVDSIDTVDLALSPLNVHRVVSVLHLVT